MRRLKVLLSAYACEPNRGSEPGVGWEWAIHLSRHCEVTVVTRANNRTVIEQASQSNSDVARVKWIYHDLSPVWLTLKKRFKTHRLYYTLWQRTLIPKLKRLCSEESFDIIHHLTFASYRYRTAIANLPGTKIWGPVGGAEQTPWTLLSFDHIPTLIHEIVRNLQARFSRFNQAITEAGRLDKILTSTFETQDALAQFGLPSLLMPTIGVRGVEEPVIRDRSESTTLRLLYVGNLQHLKGIHLVLDALSKISIPIHFTIAGKGNYSQQLRRRVAHLNLANKVTFLGYVNSLNLRNLYLTNDVFVFPSMHDSGGMALLESMTFAMPSITLASGGPRVITNPECGIQIPLQSYKGIVQSIAKAIQFYYENSSERESHGITARSRIESFFLWNKKAEAMLALYHQLTSNTSSNASNTGSYFPTQS